MSIDQDEGRFEVVQGEIDGKAIVLMRNIGIDVVAVQNDYPWFLTLQLAVADCNELGLCSRRESDRLSDVEDYLLDEVEDLQYVYVGRSTWNCIRSINLYVRDKDTALDNFLHAIKNISQEKITLHTIYDPQWCEYSKIIG